MKKHIALGMILLAVVSSQSTAAGPRLAVPVLSEQTASLHAIQNQFADLYASPARTDQLALCRQLLQASNDPATASSEQYVLICEARDVTARGGDFAAAFKICDTLVSRFDLTPTSARAGAICAAADNALGLDSPDDFFRNLLTCSDQAAQADDFEPARRMLDAGINAAAVLQAAAWDQVLQVRKTDLEIQGRGFAALAPAIEKLRQHPTDLPSKLLVGKYACFIKGDWKAGLPLLDMADDEFLHKQSRIERYEPMNDEQERREGRSDGKLQMSIADGWDNIGKTLPPGYALQLRLHVFDWYLRSLARLPSYAYDDRAHVLDQLHALLPMVAGHRPHAEIFIAINDAQSLKTVRSSAIVGGAQSSGPFKEIPGGLLIGFHYSLAMLNGQKVITCLQPIYLTSTGEQTGEQDGAMVGKPYSKLQTIRAPIGYAISAIRLGGGDCLNSITPVFSRIEKDHLNVTDSLKATRIGGDGGTASVADGHGAPIIGICGRQRDGYLGLGVVYSRVAH